ncbi:MAG TPA: lactate permease LctP family transporter [Sediminibacterium sp.]|nr:lactate permease LctP family transporter [Sediminibacterium sp.]
MIQSLPWTQVVNPLPAWPSAALVAAIPVLVIFWALVLRRMKGWQASLLALASAWIIAVLVYRMPVSISLLTAANGALYGLFPICWILISAVFLFNLTVRSGRFEMLKHSLARLTPDRRLQALLIAFSFGAFLEGTAGFGAPVAITAAMLTGLGFEPLYAAGICLVANTAPVAFGSIGIPISVMSQVTGLPEMQVSQMVGRTLPFVSLILPGYLVCMVAGWKHTRAIWPALLVSGGSFALIQALTANLLGPSLPDILAGIGSICSLIICLRYWQPGQVWRFDGEIKETVTTADYPLKRILQSLLPFGLLTCIVIVWGIPSVKQWLDTHFMTSFLFPGLENAIHSQSGKVVTHLFKLNYASAAGTAIFITAVLSLPMLGMRWQDAWRVFVQTLRQLVFPVVTIMAVLAFAYVVNDSGMSLTLAEAFARTGWLFPFFAPLLGWLGVFITGSDTSANALFGKIQTVTANAIGVSPLVTAGANISGGVVGKMISPQSIAVAAAAGGLVGREASLFRFTVKHSIILLMVICLIVFLQAYVFPWLVPAENFLVKMAGSGYLPFMAYV